MTAVDILIRNCFIKSGMHVFCSKCGKMLLQDRYNYLKHMETCDCSPDNLSLRNEFSISPIALGSHGYLFTRRGDVLKFHVYQLELWNRDRLKGFLLGRNTSAEGLFEEFDPESNDFSDHEIIPAGVWKKVFTATFRKNKVYAQNGKKSLMAWLSRGQNDPSALIPLVPNDPLRPVRNFFPGFHGDNVLDLVKLQCRLLPFRRKHPEVILPLSILTDVPEECKANSLLKADDLAPEELSFLAGRANAACVSLTAADGRPCLKVFCRTTGNQSSSPFIFIICRDHILSQISFDIRDVMLLGPEDTAPVRIAPGALEAFSAAYPELMLDAYTGRFPLLPLLAPYDRSCCELLCKAGLSRLADRILLDLPERFTLRSRLKLDESSPAGIFSLPIRFLRKLEPLTQRHDFWSVFDSLRKLYRISPAFIDMEDYSETYLSFIKQLHIGTDAQAPQPHTLQNTGYIFSASGMAISQTLLLKWLRYTIQLDQMYPGQDNYRYLSDYLHICSEVGAFIFGMMPKDIQAAHDEAAAMYRMNRDRIQLERFRKSIRSEFYAHLSTEKDEKDPKSPLYGQPYTVLLPDSPADLERESMQMRNCVRTYMSRVAQGTSLIVFLRSRSDIHRSLVTMEISGQGSLVQAKAFANRRVPKEIQAYIRLWAKTKGVRIHTGDIDAYAA